MNLISVATSKWGPPFAMLICRVLPCKLVYRCAGWLSSYLARQRHLPFIQAHHFKCAVLSHRNPMTGLHVVGSTNERL